MGDLGIVGRKKHSCYLFPTELCCELFLNPSLEIGTRKFLTGLGVSHNSLTYTSSRKVQNGVSQNNNRCLSQNSSFRYHLVVVRLRSINDNGQIPTDILAIQTGPPPRAPLITLRPRPTRPRNDNGRPTTSGTDSGTKAAAIGRGRASPRTKNA